MPNGLDKGASGETQSQLVTYVTGLDLPLYGDAVQSGDVWHYSPEHGKKFQRVTLSLHSNGFAIRPHGKGACITIAMSPFALVHAVKLHSAAADADNPTMLFFKVLVFHHGSLHFFGADGETAEKDRAQWVANIARTHREFAKSLFPCFALSTGPLPGADYSSTRLLAGYLLQCEGPQVSLMWCELHLRFDGTCVFDGFAAKGGDAPSVLGLSVESGTQISKAQGCDNGCFTLAGCNFAARTCAEKELWLRVIQNVKVKILHRTPDPKLSEARAVLQRLQSSPIAPPDDLQNKEFHYTRRLVIDLEAARNEEAAKDNMAFRAAILERIQRLVQLDDLNFTRKHLLPRSEVAGFPTAPGMHTRSGTFTRPGVSPREKMTPVRAELVFTPRLRAQSFTPSSSLQHLRPPCRPLPFSEPGQDSDDLLLAGMEGMSSSGAVKSASSCSDVDSGGV